MNRLSVATLVWQL